MLTKEFTIKNKYGIHARPAGLLVKTSSQFKASVYISKDGTEVNAKSIMGVLMLEAAFGSVVQVRIDGEDEHKAMDAIGQLIADRQFDEE